MKPPLQQGDVELGNLCECIHYHNIHTNLKSFIHTKKDPNYSVCQYFLRSHYYLQEIGDHFGPNWEVLGPKPFKLETRGGAKNQEKIEINFQRILPESGWILSLKSENKVWDVHMHM